jgi:hypothetical protein
MKFLDRHPIIPHQYGSHLEEDASQGKYVRQSSTTTPSSSLRGTIHGRLPVNGACGRSGRFVPRISGYAEVGIEYPFPVYKNICGFDVSMFNSFPVQIV